MSSKTCSHFHLLLIAFLFLLSMTSISLNCHSFSFSSLFFLVYPFLYLTFSLCFPFPYFANIKPSCFTLSFWPLQLTLSSSTSHITIISTLDAKCLPYQSHFLIHSFPLATDCSISHCPTLAFNPSHPVVVMVNSISHTPHTHPHHAQPLPSER